MTIPRPMRASLGVLPSEREDEQWAYEIKWDGYRVIADVDVAAQQARLWSSRGIDLSARFAPCAQVWRAVNAASAILDGEVVALDERGRPSFQALQQSSGSLVYVLFDVLAVNGTDVTGLAFADRRRLLEQLVDEGPAWRVASSQRGGGADLAAVTREAGLEGVMAKRLDSVYQPGRRSTAWRKIKHRLGQEFVIGGFAPGSGRRDSTFGAVLIGCYEGGALRYAGRVGSGFTERTLTSVRDRLQALATTQCPFEPRPPRDAIRGATWVQPVLVAQIEFAEWTADGVIRQPVFLGLRDDKDARDVTREA
jgi:bifunctional non-homologous end joining protein LigD